MSKKKKFMLAVAGLIVIIAILAMMGNDDKESTNDASSRPANAAMRGGELVPVLPDIAFAGEAEEGGEITRDMIPPGALAAIEDNGVLNPNEQFRVTKAARTIRRIVKQDVYGRELGDEFYYYRNTLSSAEKTLYDQIYANCVENDPVFNIQSRVNHARAPIILQAVLFDNPDLFWVDPSISYSYGNDGFIASVTLKFNECARDLDAFKKVFYDCADSALEQAMKLENDVLKVKYIHDLLTYINDYDLRAPLNQSAYSAIVNRRTVCAGYAAAFTYYMQRLGIPSLIVEGYAGENHAWNMVKLYGEYYEMDVTWNDPVGNPPNKFYYNYFNITTNEMHRSRNRDRASASNIPIATGTRYSYPGFFGNSPGSSFSQLNYGRPSVRLPHIYPDEASQTAVPPVATAPAAAPPAATAPAATAAAAPAAAAVRPAEAPASAQPSITLVNNTGQDIWWVYISLTTDDSWGGDRLSETETLDRGQSVSLRLPYAIQQVNRYDILLEASDNTTYIKMNAQVSDNGRIVFTSSDRDGGSEPAFTPPALASAAPAGPSPAPMPAQPAPAARQTDRSYVMNAMQGWGQCRNIALTGTQGIIALYARNGYAASGLPSSLPGRLQQVVNANERIEDVHIAESGGWLLLTQNNVYWEGINANLENKIREAGRNGESISSAAFNDKGDWIFVTNSSFSSSNSDIQRWLLDGYNQYGSILSATITDDGMAAVYQRGYQMRGAPQGLVNALNGTRLTVARIKFSGTAWFFADANGNYSCSF